MVADIVAFTTHTAGGVLYRGESFRKKIIEILAIFLIALHEFSRFSPELFVAQRLILKLDSINALNYRLTLFKVLAVVTAREFLKNGSDHKTSIFIK